MIIDNYSYFVDSCDLDPVDYSEFRKITQKHN